MASLPSRGVPVVEAVPAVPIQPARLRRRIVAEASDTEKQVAREEVALLRTPRVAEAVRLPSEVLPMVQRQAPAVRDIFQISRAPTNIMRAAAAAEVRALQVLAVPVVPAEVAAEAALAVPGGPQVPTAEQPAHVLEVPVAMVRGARAEPIPVAVVVVQVFR